MKINVVLFTLSVFLFFTPFSQAQDNGSDEGKRIDEIIKGERTHCASVDQGLTPTLLFETLSPKVLINEDSLSLTLQMKIIYYRCIKSATSDTPTFAISEPNDPYNYTIEQLDGTTTTIQVKKQTHRFMIKYKNLNLDAGYPQKIGNSGNVHLIQTTIPIKKLLTPSQEIKLRNGSEINVTIPVVSEVSADYAIEKQTKSNTDFTPGNTFNWNINLTMNGKKSLKAVLISIK
jgi:hypothetical protein